MTPAMLNREDLYNVDVNQTPDRFSKLKVTEDQLCKHLSSPETRDAAKKIYDTGRWHTGSSRIDDASVELITQAYKDHREKCPQLCVYF